MTICDKINKILKMGCGTADASFLVLRLVGSKISQKMENGVVFIIEFSKLFVTIFS